MVAFSTIRTFYSNHKIFLTSDDVVNEFDKVSLTMESPFTSIRLFAVKKLYELGKELNWNTTTDLDWTQDPYPLNQWASNPEMQAYRGFGPYEKLSEKEKNYAAADVQYLFLIKTKLESMLKRENRYEIFLKCMAFLDTRIELDNLGFDKIFDH